MTRLRLDEPRERGRPGAYAAYTALTSFELADPLRGHSARQRQLRLPCQDVAARQGAGERGLPTSLFLAR